MPTPSSPPVWPALHLPLLLATEHTEHDAGAEALAFALARGRGMPLAAVLPMALDAELEMAAPEAAERADLDAARRRAALQAAALAAGVALDLKLRRGPQPHTEIADEARALGAGLLIIRRRGRRGLLANLLVGEMVSRVLDQAPCSVLVVPRDARPWRREVLVGLQPQTREPTRVAAAAALAQESGAGLHVVCVAAHDSECGAAESALAHALAAARAAGSGGPSTTGEVRIGLAHAQILAAAAARGAELLVVGRDSGAPAGITGIPASAARPRLGPTAREVTGHAACPVLVHLPPPTDAPQNPRAR